MLKINLTKKRFALSKTISNQWRSQKGLAKTVAPARYHNLSFGGFTPLESSASAENELTVYRRTRLRLSPIESRQSMAKLLTGFTLIELLVVIAIIAILSMGIVALYNQSRAQARDARRVSDMAVFNQALALYVLNYQKYPVSNNQIPPGDIINGQTDPLSVALKNNGILQFIPLDPGTYQHYYYLSDPEGKIYTLTYCLETSFIVGLASGCHSQTF